MGDTKELPQKRNIRLTHGPVILLQHIYPKEIKAGCQKIFAHTCLQQHYS